MSHPHEQIITDEDSEQTLGSHHFPEPLGWKVLIQPNQVKKKTAGGIILSTQSQENEEYLTAHGTILALGKSAYCDRETGKKWEGKWPEAGDRITYGKYAGQKLVINGVKLLLLNDDEVTSILPEGANITTYV
jgi:co-chaperonin GroES (HSP10)